MQESIEILSTRLLDDHRITVNRLRRLARSLSLDFGWHYLLDLTWIIHKLGEVRSKQIMDAGAGTGILQWYLALEGGFVLSVDRMTRADLPLRFRTRFRVSGLRPGDLIPGAQVYLDGFRKPASLKEKLVKQTRDLLGMVDIRRSPGKVTIYNQDLNHLAEIKDNTLDAVVAVSALEHNQPEDLQQVIDELMRVLKPGGVLLATLGAARDEDWFHAPSHGWCYTEATLRRLFNLPAEAFSNYDQYDRLFGELIACAELRDNLAQFYFRSGDNGMPWGVWEPKYQSVGVCKIKPSQHIAPTPPLKDFRSDQLNEITQSETSTEMRQ